MADIDLTQLTNSNNTGVFDILNSIMEEKILEQYTEGRIKSTDYAQVYLQSLQGTLQQAIKFLSEEQMLEVNIDKEKENVERIKAEVASIYAKLENLKADEDATRANIKVIEAEEAAKLADTIRKDNESVEKVKLLQAQTLGFKTNSKNEVLKILMDSNVAQYAETASDAVVPSHAKAVSLESFITELKTDINSV